MFVSILAPVLSRSPRSSTESVIISSVFTCTPKMPTGKSVFRPRNTPKFKKNTKIKKTECTQSSVKQLKIDLKNHAFSSEVISTLLRLRGNKPVPEGSFINKNGHRLHDFVKKHDLAIMNTFWRTKKCQMDTWRHTSGFMKTVDYILCDGLTSSWGTNCRVRSSYDFQSDHFL